MLEHLLVFSILRMARVFRISRNGLYYWVENRLKVADTKILVKNVMAQGAFRRYLLRAVINIMLRPLSLV